MFRSICKRESRYRPPVRRWPIVRLPALLFGLCALVSPGLAETTPSGNLLTNSSFLQCTNPGIPDHWGVMTGLAGLPGVHQIPDWNADSYQTRPISPVPGTHSLRIACKARVQSTPMKIAPRDIFTLSVYLKGEHNGATAALCIGDNVKTVEVGTEWSRHSFTGHIRENGHWRRDHLAVAFVANGPGAVWLAAPQLEPARPATAVGAGNWQSSVDSAYEIDEQVCHSGRRSMKCAATSCGDFDRPGGSQRIVLPNPTTGKIVLSGWCKSTGVPGHSPPGVTLEMFHADNSDLAKPNQTVSLPFAGGSHDWEHKEIEVSPKIAVKFLVVKPTLGANEGTAWFDDLAVKAMLAQGGDGTGPDPAMEEDAADDDVPDSGPAKDVLANSGFEEVEEREAFLPNSQASAYQPSEADRFLALLSEAPPPPSIACPKVETPPEIDGKIDEAEWAGATTVAELVRAADGGRAAARTRCSLMRDDKALYLAFRCEMPLGKDAAAAQGSPVQPDRVAVEVKPDPARKWFCRAAVDADGNRQATCVVDKPFSILTLALQSPKKREWPWDRDWTSGVKKGDGFWTAEVAIPFSSIERWSDADCWALNLYRSVSGEESAWSPTYLGAWRSGHWSLTFRSVAERYRFGSLRGMSGIPALSRQDGLHHLSDIAFQYRPDHTLSLLAEIENPIHDPRGERAVLLEVEVAVPGKEPAKGQAAVKLTSKTQRVRLDGLKLEPIPGSYQFKARLIDAEDGFVFHRVDSWQSVAYGRTVDEGTAPPGLLFDHTYFPRLYELRAETELSYYTDEAEARLLVESALPEASTVTVTLAPREGGRNRKQVGQRELPSGGRIMMSLDIKDLQPGVYDLEIAARPAKAGQVQTEKTPGDEGNAAKDSPTAAALAELVKLPTRATGARINRFTGCLWRNGRPAIIHAAHLPFNDRCIDFLKSHNLNGLMLGMSVPESGKEAVVAGITQQLDALHAGGIGVIAWLGGTDADMLRAIVAFRDHPAVLAWKIIDEPYGDPGALLRRYEAAKEADPYRPAFINWDHWYPRMGGRGSLLATDIGSRDTYPSGASSWVVDLARPIPDMAVAFSVMGRDCAALGKAAGFWQQIYGTDDAFREPTPAELRCLVFLGLIHRVRLTYYFTAIPMCVALWDTLTELGDAMKTLNERLASPKAIELDRGVKGPVHYSLWRTGEDTACLLMCNTDGADTDLCLPLAPFGLPSRAVTRRHKDGGTAPVEDGQFRTRLAGHEAVMVFISPLATHP